MNRNGQQLEAAVLRILRSVVDLDIGIDFEAQALDGRHDAMLRYGNDQQVAVVIEYKLRANSATAHQAVAYANSLGNTPLLFVVGETTGKAREILRDHNVAFIDGLGNVELELPGLIYRFAGAKAPARAKAPVRLSGKSGLVAVVLLEDPARQWQIKELSASTGVSQGLVHRVVARLQDEGVLAVTGDGPQRTRSVSNPTALLDLWVEEQRDKTVRTTGYQLAQTHTALLSALTSALAAADIGYAVTGAAAAATVAPLATSVATTEVWVDGAVDPRHLFDVTPVEAVDSGANVVFLQANNNSPLLHRQLADGMWLTSNLRLYFDLLNDPRRGSEQAEHLRQQVIGF